MMTIEELQAHYKAVRERLNSPPKREAPIKLICKKLELGPYPDPLDGPPPVEVPAKAPAEAAETPARRILSEVADRHNMPVAAFRSDSRKMPFVRLRQEACYRLSMELGFSLSQIGRLMGNRDHTTVLNAIHMHKKLRGEGYPIKKRKREQNDHA